MTAIPKETWDAIQLRYVQGENPNAISRSLNGRPTKQGIAKRARKEDWEQLPTVAPKHFELSPEQLGRDTPANRQKVLDMLAESVPYSIAARSIGVHPNTLLDWRKKDVQFAIQCETARGKAHADCVTSVYQARSKDWKAGKYILETAAETCEEYSSDNRKEPVELILHMMREPGPTTRQQFSPGVVIVSPGDDEEGRALREGRDRRDTGKNKSNSSLIEHQSETVAEHETVVDDDDVEAA